MVSAICSMCKGDYRMKKQDIHIRDPFILEENGVYYLYGSCKTFSGKMIDSGF